MQSLAHLMKFHVGKIVSTPGALEATTPVEVFGALVRHVQGDWGDVCPGDKRANDRALKDGSRLLSIYHTAKGKKFWIITEAMPRKYTTLLLPEEY